MDLKSIIKGKSELTSQKATSEPIVLSSRIRLARNLEDYFFPGWANGEMRDRLFDLCGHIVKESKAVEGGELFNSADLSELDKKVLVERHLVSPEFIKEKSGSGVIFDPSQSCSVMINEEDHFRLQVLKKGYNFDKLWKTINNLDSEIEAQVNYAYSPELGYLTACPTNLGTGMRASVMMHLPGLVIIGQMEKVVRACNQLNLAVRGIYGEGSEASGSIFQISNQQTLGESEAEIIKRLKGVLDTIIEQEKNARKQLLEQEPAKICDKIGRAYGILRHGFFVNSSEAMNLLSLIRLGIDLKVIEEKHRKVVDRLFIETQPGHVEVLMRKGEVSTVERDIFRATLLRDKFESMPEPNFDDVMS